MKRVHVVGGGFSGLTLAWRLAERGIQVELYEKSSRLGGLIATLSFDEGLVETAANAMMRTPHVEELFRELGLEALAPLKASRRRYIWRKTRLRRWPLGIWETLVFAVKAAATFGWKKKHSAPRSGQTVQQWGEQSVGKPATKFLLSPGLQGIYAGDPRKMSASLILGPLFQPRAKYRGLLAPEKGMQQLIDALEKKLRQKGVHIHMQTEFKVDFAGNEDIVFACPPAMTADYLEDLSPTTAQWLRQITMAPLITATLFFKKPQTTVRGFGCLFPRGEGFRTLGLLLNPFIFAGRDRVYNETFILGGATDPAVLELSNEQLIWTLQTERERALGERLEIQRAKITRWPQALPHYDTALEKVLSKISLPDKIHLHGNYLGGIGLSKILDRSYQLANEIAGA